MLVTGLAVPIAAFALIDETEHEARRRSANRAILGLRSLAALCELPHRIPVPQASLSPAVRKELAQLPGWAVHLGGNVAERRVNTPVRLAGVIAAATRWQAAGAILGEFVTVAPRVAVLRAGEPLRPEVHAEAMLWDIGLVREGDVPEVLLEPGPPSIEHGPFQWWLAERTYAAWLSNEAAKERPMPPVVV